MICELNHLQAIAAFVVSALEIIQTANFKGPKKLKELEGELNDIA